MTKWSCVSVWGRGVLVKVWRTAVAFKHQIFPSVFLPPTSRNLPHVSLPILTKSPSESDPWPAAFRYSRQIAGITVRFPQLSVLSFVWPFGADCCPHEFIPSCEWSSFGLLISLGMPVENLWLPMVIGDSCDFLGQSSHFALVDVCDDVCCLCEPSDFFILHLVS